MSDPTDASRYFAHDPEAHPAGGIGRFVDLAADVAPIEFVTGLEFRPVLGEGMMVNFVHYQPNVEAPMHSHEEEQITFVIDGAFEFDLDGEARVMRRGTAVVVPPWVTHEAACFEIDVFRPPRAVLLDAMGPDRNPPDVAGS
jgi:unsaturated pyranuronate lyase